MTTEPDAEEVRYRLGGREKRGLLAGWRAGQIASVASGLVVAVGMLRISTGAFGLIGALLAVLAGVACAVWPVRGRTVDEWLPALARQAALAATRQDRWRSAEPWSGRAMAPAAAHARRSSGAAGTARGAGRRPVGCFASLEVEAAVVGRSAEVGVVRDARAGTSSVVMSVAGSGYPLLGPGERAARVSAWSRLLASVARDGTALHRLQWVERCVPDDLDGLRRHFRASSTARAGSPEHRSYAELLDGTAGAGYRHELYLVVTVRDRRVASPRSGSTTNAEHARAAVFARLAEEAASLETALRHADAVVHGALAPDALRGVLGASFSSSPPEVLLAGGAQSRRAGRASWPSACDVRWDALRTDGTWHASYWIAEWPRTDVGNDFLLPLVAGAGARRTLAVTLAPVAPLRASRDAEHARTSGVADAELRRRHGFAITARARRDHDAVLQRESELAAGHASYRFSGFVTVTDTTPERLERSCETVERAAAGCQLELRRLYGAQDVGFLATLPIGAGLD